MPRRRRPPKFLALPFNNNSKTGKNQKANYKNKIKIVKRPVSDGIRIKNQKSEFPKTKQGVFNFVQPLEMLKFGQSYKQKN